ncbi:MAG TPA: hypothetical protein VLA43_11060, partial [Longimicrobiales bacterium]|nr:hypothetical protein [Longimicrobiales bacterium]
DPRVPPVSRAQMRARLAAYREAQEMDRTADEARTRLREALRGVTQAMEASDGEVAAQGRALRNELTALQERLFTGAPCQGICPGDPVAAAIGQPLFRLRSGKGAPTPVEELLLARASEALDRVLAEVNQVLSGSVAAFRDALLEAGYTPLPDVSPIRRGAR